MALLLNYVNLSFRIFIPASGEIRQFDHGKLVIDESDPAYEAVMGEALANPNIRIVMQAGDSNVIAKEAASFACDACNPMQAFDSKADLLAHTKLVHLAKPELTEEFQVREAAETATEPPRAKRRRPGEVEAIPAAQPGRHA